MLGCCDCGLTHELRARVTPTGRVKVKLRRREDMTDELRRRRKRKKPPKARKKKAKST